MPPRRRDAGYAGSIPIEKEQSEPVNANPGSRPGRTTTLRAGRVIVAPRVDADRLPMAARVRRRCVLLRTNAAAVTRGVPQADPCRDGHLGADVLAGPRVRRRPEAVRHGAPMLAYSDRAHVA